MNRLLNANGWNHSTHYHRELLRCISTPCCRALDVGCGEGQFARRLAKHAGRVDALDTSTEVLARAQVLSAGIPNLRFVRGDFMALELETGAYDFVAAVAVLHHMPLVDALLRMRDLLSPGGTLGIIGLFHERTIPDYLLSAIALPVSNYFRLTRQPAPMNAPICAPSMPMSEIRACVSSQLPGAVVRRHLLWRYTVVWRKPR